MSEKSNLPTEVIPTKEFLINEVTKIKSELEELKNLKDQTFRSSSLKRKPVRKAVKKKAVVKRKPVRKAVKKVSKPKQSKKSRR